MKKCNCGYISKNGYDYDNHIYNCKGHIQFNKHILHFIIVFMIIIITWLLIIHPYLIKNYLISW